MKNFYPEQYAADSALPINHNYLTPQFNDCDIILEKIKQVVLNNDFTLGSTVDEVEDIIASLCNVKYAIGVGSGTDALFLSLKALGIGPGDEVITSTYTFYATVGAIVTAGAKPVFCDCKDDLNIDETLLESLITSSTKAIIPVHWTGRPCNMDTICELAVKHNIYIVEDACHALGATFHDQPCGSFGSTGCFSFHPLKNLNVWGDGGIITTNNTKLADKLRLIRNHGLSNRNICNVFAYNSRLDTIQAVVAKHVLETKLSHITLMRKRNSSLLDQGLTSLSGIETIPRLPYLSEVHHLYTFFSDNRDLLAAHLISKGIDAKIHYPIPMHLQPASKDFGYGEGDFPNAEYLSNRCISLPVHEFVTEDMISLMIDSVCSFSSL